MPDPQPVDSVVEALMDVEAYHKIMKERFAPVYELLAERYSSYPRQRRQTDEPREERT